MWSSIWERFPRRLNFKATSETCAYRNAIPFGFDWVDCCPHIKHLVPQWQVQINLTLNATESCSEPSLPIRNWRLSNWEQWLQLQLLAMERTRTSKTWYMGHWQYQLRRLPRKWRIRGRFGPTWSWWRSMVYWFRVNWVWEQSANYPFQRKSWLCSSCFQWRPTTRRSELRRQRCSR